MKNKNANLVSVKIRKIVYDVDGTDNARKLPRTLTVKADEDMLEIVSECDDGLDNVDESEFIGELIEEKIGTPVRSFEYCI